MSSQAMLLKVEPQNRHPSPCQSDKDEKEEKDDSSDQSESEADEEAEDEDGIPFVPQHNNANSFAWKSKPAPLSSLRQYLTLRLKKTGPIKERKPNSDPSANSMLSLIRKLASCRTGNNNNNSARVSNSSSQIPANRKSMAYRRCLRIRASQARNFSANHPPLGQVFAQTNFSPDSLITPDEEETTTDFHRHADGNEANGSRRTMPSRGGERNLDKQNKPSVWAVRFYNSFRRPKKTRSSVNNNINVSSNNEFNPNGNYHIGGQCGGILANERVETVSPSGVKLLQLPACNQPLLRRYGVMNDFVFVVDWNEAECKNSNFSVTAQNPLRSVMRKPDQDTKSALFAAGVPRRKKCVKFLDSVSTHDNNSSNSTSV